MFTLLASAVTNCIEIKTAKITTYIIVWFFYSFRNQFIKSETSKRNVIKQSNYVTTLNIITVIMNKGERYVRDYKYECEFK
jgi:hypothetical protein